MSFATRGLNQETGGIVSRDKQAGRATVVQLPPGDEGVSSRYKYARRRGRNRCEWTCEGADAGPRSRAGRDLVLSWRGWIGNMVIPVTAWEAMGRPEPPMRKQTEELRKLAWNTNKKCCRRIKMANYISD